jgi:hypothetical protein
MILFLLYFFTLLFATQSSGQITDITVADIQEIPPDVVGIYQQMVFLMSVSPPPPLTESFDGFTITLTKPDGVKETLGPYTSDPTGSSYAIYTPDQLGTWYAEFNFPGQGFDVPYREYSASSDNTSFIVQQDPVVIKYPTVDVTVSPDPVGIDQMMQIRLAFSPLPPRGTDVFHDFEINILGAGSFGPFDSSPEGEYYLRYTPKNTGNYSAYVYYPGEWFSANGSPYGEYYYPMSTFFSFLVRDSPVLLPLTISISGSGSTNPASGTRSYEPGEDVTIVASPDPNWKFSHWILDGADAGTNPNYLISMFDNHVLTAVFELEETVIENDPPQAVIDSIEPSSGKEYAVQGESISFRGSGYDDGYVVGYRWISSIDGLLSESEDFSISSLSVGTHLIYFDVLDNQGEWSSLASQFIVVESSLRIDDGISAGVVATVAGSIFIPSASVGFYHFYYKNRLPCYPRTFFNKSPSSKQIKEIQKEKTKKQKEKEEEEKKKYKRSRKKGKPFLSLDVELPQNVSKLKSYKAKLIIRNEGQAKATEIKIEAAATRGITLEKPPDQATQIDKGKHETFDFPFKVDKSSKKGVYTIRFNVKCKETSPRKIRGYTRAAKIGLLTNPKKPNSLAQVKNWLDKNAYSWNEMEESCDKISSLFAYDLLIIPPELEMPPKWVTNISTFVDNSQSILLIDKIITSETDVVAETLGYEEIEYEPFKVDQGFLKIEEEHSITEGFVAKDKIPLSACWGNPCKQVVSTGKIVASFYDKDNPDSAIPAITYNEYEEGKTVHLNFHAEENTEQLDQILKNSIEWLL